MLYCRSYQFPGVSTLECSSMQCILPLWDHSPAATGRRRQVAGKASQALRFSACSCTSPGLARSTYSQKPDEACCSVASLPQRNSSCRPKSRLVQQSCQSPLPVSASRSDVRRQGLRPMRKRPGAGTPSCSKPSVVVSASSAPADLAVSSFSATSGSTSCLLDSSGSLAVLAAEWQTKSEAGSSVMMQHSTAKTSATVRKRLDRRSRKKTRASCTGAGSVVCSNLQLTTTAASAAREARRGEFASNTSRKGGGASTSKLRQASACARILPSSFTCRTAVLRLATRARKARTVSLGSMASRASGNCAQWWHPRRNMAKAASLLFAKATSPDMASITAPTPCCKTKVRSLSAAGGGRTLSAGSSAAGLHISTIQGRKRFPYGPWHRAGPPPRA
mmetsp:Transcript_72579/g.200198  ORF Transcript_72579/g.200198 Transcript_72579/m.200198 type:complete len:391 (-) Transcript_72579:7-1179(-)